MQPPSIVPAQTALLITHYQTDIRALFPDVAPVLLATTRKLCDAARARANLQEPLAAPLARSVGSFFTPDPDNAKP